MNPTAIRIVRHETIGGNIGAIWDDGNGNRWRRPVAREYELVW